MNVAKKALPPECISFTDLEEDGDGGAGSSIAKECSEAMRGIKISSETVLGTRGQPTAYDMQRRSHMMVAKDKGGHGNAAVILPKAVHYDERTRYNKMYVDWDDENSRWNAREAVGPLRITVLDGDPAFDVEVDRGERKRYPQELIRAVVSFRKSLGDSGILG